MTLTLKVFGSLMITTKTRLDVYNRLTWQNQHSS
eukprot:SAG22_NODE_27_length_29018_cov_465.809646_31_plen_34_part_00